MSEGPGADLTLGELMDLMVAKDFTEVAVGALVVKRDSTAMSHYNQATADAQSVHAAKATWRVGDTMPPAPPVESDADRMKRMQADEEALLYASAGV